MQQFRTWLTGMPLADRRLAVLWTPLPLAACTAGGIVLGPLTGAAALNSPLWATMHLLPISGIFTTATCGVRRWSVNAQAHNRKVGAMFTYHTKETAPADSLPLIELSIKTYGFFPRMHQILAEAPLTYEMYNTALDGLSNRSTFSPVEQELIMLTASYENRGNYSMAGHTMRAQRKHVPTTVIAALRDGVALTDAKLEALRTFVRSMLEKRGHVGDDELLKFLNAGYSKRQALEVLTGLAAKLISDFTNALAHTELDDAVKPLSWTHPSERNT
jgi:alkylhydroperoxidase family enzyme